MRHAPVSISRTHQVDPYSSKEFIFRLLAFIILENGFLALAGRSLLGPLILSIPPRMTFDETKGGFTIISIIWHALATMVIKDAILQVFSSEWFPLYQQTGCLQSSRTDRVSRLTAGLITKVRHLISRAATRRYRVSVVVWLLLMAIGGLGPSTISVANTFVSAPIQITLANVTLPIFNTSAADFAVATSRANTILRLEVFEKVTFGHNSSGNTLIPWPIAKPGEKFDWLSYRSDALSFDFTCSWNKPTFKNLTSDNTVFWAVNNRTFVCDVSDILDGSQGTSRMSPWPTSSFDTGWLLVSFDSTNSTQQQILDIDLSNLPTTDLQTQPSVFPQILKSATALICNSHLNFFTADVTLADGTLTAVPVESDKVGNFESSPTVQYIFLSNVLASIIYFFPDSPNGVSSKIFNSISRLLFFCEEDDPCDSTFKPLPVPVIRNNMNRFFRSATKAFLDGYNGTRPGYGTISLPNFNTFTANATGREVKLALVTSQPFFIALAVVVASIELLLLTLFFLIDPQYMKCFNLDNILHAVEKPNNLLA